MHVLAPAKINLHLRVGPRRPDGFHPLLSWMCTVGLFDSLTFERTLHAVPREWTLRCDRPDLPCGVENLVSRSAAALAAVCPEPLGVDAFLKKSIPSGAGLGGGSSDAARTLLALNRFYDSPLSFAELTELAATLGSDVPFFLHEPSAICQGRGERIEKIPPPISRWAILILPPIHCATPLIYKRFDQMGLGNERAISEPFSWQEWTQLPSLELLPNLINDLEAPAFSLFPELQAMRQQAEQIVGRPVRMSGSGSSLFSLFDHSGESATACTLLQSTLRAQILPIPLAPSLTDDLSSI